MSHSLLCLLVGVQLVAVGIRGLVVGFDHLATVDVIPHSLIGEASVPWNVDSAVPVPVGNLRIASHVLRAPVVIWLSVDFRLVL